MNIGVYFLAPTQIHAQQDLTSYYMNALPQSTANNPALSPDSRWYVGFPGLSSFYLGISNNLFDTKNVIQRRSDDSLTINTDNFLSDLKKSNYLKFNMQMDLFALGFRMKQNYISISYSVKSFAQINYAKDFPRLLIKGNYDSTIMKTQGQTFDFSNTGVNAMVYEELAIGFNRKITSKLTAGIRVKALFGIADVQTKKSEGTLFTSSEQTFHDQVINAGFNLNTCYPDDKHSSQSDFSGTKNMGFGIDLGGFYRINQKFSVNAAVLDLGYIRWKSNPTNYGFTADNVTFTFQGLDINKMYNFENKKFVEDTVYKKQLEDSLNKIFKTKESHNSYTTMLPLKIQVGGAFHLSDNDVVGVLFRGDFLAKKLYPAVAVSYNRKLTRFVQVAASYSIRNRSYTNLGVGLVLSLGPIQLYALTDNILVPFQQNKITWDKNQSSISYPYNTKNINFRFGFNIVGGRSKAKRTDTFSNEYSQSIDYEVKRKVDKSNKKKEKEVKVKDDNKHD